MDFPARHENQVPRRVRQSVPGARAWGSVWETGRHEGHLLVWPTEDAPFAGQWSAVQAAYAATCASLGFSPDTETQLTLYLSDPSNQRSLLESFLAGRGRTAVSLLGQAPAGNAARVALRAVHVGGVAKFARPDGGLRLTHGAHGHVWFPDLVAPEGAGAGAQSAAVFAGLRARADAEGVGLAQALVRTWIILRDIDEDYAALLPARSAAFRDAGLGALLPASTGIGGAPACFGARIGLTALLYAGLAPGQVAALEAPDHLPPAPSYGASFERGLVLRFGDRRHLHVSGTASIGPEGDILHPGDVVAQTRRTVLNIEALLASASANARTMAYLLVYLRDAAEAGAVEAVLASSALGEVPRLVLHAPVCRPGWLVEIEGQGIDPSGDHRWAAF